MVYSNSIDVVVARRYVEHYFDCNGLERREGTTREGRTRKGGEMSRISFRRAITVLDIRAGATIGGALKSSK